MRFSILSAFFFRAATLLVAALLLCSSCGQTSPEQLILAEGVVFRDDKQAGIVTITLERDIAPYRPSVVAENVARVRNNVVGDAYTPIAWARKYDALAAVNGGFFGDTYDNIGRRKQIVQLAVVESKVVAPGTVFTSTQKSGEKYVRSAIGFDHNGNPTIEWATGEEERGARRFDKPVNPSTGASWDIESGIACGPRLIHRGKIEIADKAERLIHVEMASRMSVAYNDRFLVFCRAESKTYRQLADYLVAYFRETLQSTPSEALCLDGGPSAQMAYREGPGWRDTIPTGVQVPTAIILLPKTLTAR